MRWIIGDIHGMARPLDALLDMLWAIDRHAHFIFVGDYINRGPDSPAVVRRMLSLEHATFLRGNHDDIFDLILNGHSYAGQQHGFDPLSAFGMFMNHGLDQTLCAYGADLAELQFLQSHPDLDRLAQVLTVVPEAHRQFFNSLLPVAEFAEFFVAHAGWHIDTPDSSPDLRTRLHNDPRLRYPVLWGRYTDAQIDRNKAWHRTGYFGHTPVSNYRKALDLTPVRGPQIVLLDTGVALFAQGRLSAVSPDSHELVQVDRAGRRV